MCTTQRQLLDEILPVQQVPLAGAVPAWRKGYFFFASRVCLPSLISIGLSIGLYLPREGNTSRSPESSDESTTDYYLGREIWRAIANIYPKQAPTKWEFCFGEV